MFTHEDGSVHASPTAQAVTGKVKKEKESGSGNSKKKPEPHLGLSKDTISQRKNDLMRDLEQLKQKMAELDKQKSDAIALAHALNGAIQQCDDFLDKLGVGNNADSSIPQN